MEGSKELSGIPSLTVPIVIMTGITGHIVAKGICKIFKITKPIARTWLLSSVSHAMGTAKPMERGEIGGR